MYVLLVVLILSVVRMFGSGERDEIQELNYTEVLEMIEADELERVMTSGNTLIASTRDSGIPASEFGIRYNVTALLPSVEQFYADVNKIYAVRENVDVDQISVSDYGFTIAVKMPEGTPWWLEIYHASAGRRLQQERNELRPVPRADERSGKEQSDLQQCGGRGGGDRGAA